MAEKNPRGDSGNPTGQNGATADPYNDELIIEVGDERNRNIMWAPTKVVLRGRWARANLLPTEMVESIVRLPDIPGIHILISPSGGAPSSGGQPNILL